MAVGDNDCVAVEGVDGCRREARCEVAARRRGVIEAREYVVDVVGQVTCSRVNQNLVLPCVGEPPALALEPAVGLYDLSPTGQPNLDVQVWSRPLGVPWPHRPICQNVGISWPSLQRFSALVRKHITTFACISARQPAVVSLSHHLLPLATCSTPCGASVGPPPNRPAPAVHYPPFPPYVPALADRRSASSCRHPTPADPPARSLA